MLNKLKPIKFTLISILSLIFIVSTIILTPVNNFKAKAASSAKLKTFLVVTTTANNVLASKAPREIAVDAPEKYIESVEVIHKKGGTFTTNIGNSLSLTNIDVKTIGSNVRAVTVTAGNSPVKTMKRFDSNLGDNDQKFQIGLSSLPDDDFDIVINVYNNSTIFNATTLIETKIFKVPAGSGQIFKVSEKFKYKTAGTTYSIYDLLSNLTLFQDLLTEHKIDDLWIYY